MERSQAIRLIPQMIPAALLADLISARVHLRRVGRVWLGRCPSGKHEDKHPSFYVFADRDNGHGRFKCHGCDWSGNEITWRRFVGETVRAIPDPKWAAEHKHRQQAEVRWQRLLDRCPDLPDEAKMFVDD